MTWLDPNGEEMSDSTWNDPSVRCLGVHFCGGKIDVDEYGEPIIGDHILMLFNANHTEEIEFQLPNLAAEEPWQRVFDTALFDENGTDILQNSYSLKTCSLVVLKSPFEEAED